jgi:hypothetical protein
MLALPTFSTSHVSPGLDFFFSFQETSPTSSEAVEPEFEVLCVSSLLPTRIGSSIRLNLLFSILSISSILPYL